MTTLHLSLEVEAFIYPLASVFALSKLTVGLGQSTGGAWQWGAVPIVHHVIPVKMFVFVSGATMTLQGLVISGRASQAKNAHCDS